MRFLRRLYLFFVYKVVYRANNVKYLRFLGAKIGNNCSIYTKPSFFGTEPYLIEIGDNVTIAPECQFVTHDASSRLFRNNYPDEMSKFGDNFAPIIIEDNCFIGIRSIILPGVTIKRNSIVGAGSVVNKSFSEGSVIVGVPARKISTLENYIEKYKKKFPKVQATSRDELRKELTMRFFNEIR